VKIITALLVSAISLFATAWYLMLLIGIVHLHLAASVPAVGYWVTFPMALLLCCIFDSGMLRHRYDEKAGM
jgi:hypothetical protein